MKERLDTEEFIRRAKVIHGDKYDYSKVEYTTYMNKVCIICPKHGEFWQTPNNHLHKTKPKGCPLCTHRSFALTTKEFIEKAREAHGDKYDYSKVEYINNHTKVCIICPTHGEFWQNPSTHLNGCGCKLCSNETTRVKYTKSQEQFILDAQEIHGNKYDYSKVEYINAHTKVCIICPQHGEFWQTPHKHINGKRGCPTCGIVLSSINRALTTDDFIRKAKQIHGNKYNYSKVVYINTNTEVCIICPKHGEFWQKPFNHLHGAGCTLCNGGVKYTKDDFIQKAKQIHGDKYDYSKVEYVNCFEPVCIICPQHGEFWQMPSKHLYGHGCSRCMTSSLENELIDLFTRNQIIFNHQHKFDWLGRQSLDFYLPQYNVAIECQGEQHFHPVDFFGGEEGYKVNLERDERKRRLCEINDVKLLYYSKASITKNEEIITSTKELIKQIKKKC